MKHSPFKQKTLNRKMSILKNARNSNVHMFIESNNPKMGQDKDEFYSELVKQKNVLKEAIDQIIKESNNFQDWHINFG